MDKIPHIFDSMEKADFNFDEVGTKFQGSDLVIYYGGRYLRIENFFEIMKKRKVKLSDFK